MADLTRVKRQLHYKLNTPCYDISVNSTTSNNIYHIQYLHTYIHTYRHTYTHTYIHTYIHTYLSIYLSTHCFLTYQYTINLFSTMDTSTDLFNQMSNMKITFKNLLLQHYRHESCNIHWIWCKHICVSVNVLIWQETYCSSSVHKIQTNEEQVLTLTKWLEWQGNWNWASVTTRICQHHHLQHTAIATSTLQTEKNNNNNWWI